MFEVLKLCFLPKPSSDVKALLYNNGHAAMGFRLKYALSHFKKLYMFSLSTMDPTRSECHLVKIFIKEKCAKRPQAFGLIE